MTTYSLAPLKLTAVRLTKLDSCGVYDTGSCAMFAHAGYVKIEQTGETADGEEFELINGNGDTVGYEKDAARLKYLNLKITVAGAVPELVGWMTGEDVLYSDAATPSAIGWRTSNNTARLANFALEGWTRLLGAASCAGSGAYGYALYPWLVQGTMLDVTWENGLAELVISARTQLGSPWGYGPYSIQKSEAVATLGVPIPLLESVSSTVDHRFFQRTTLAPPLTTTNCTTVVGAMSVVDDDGAGAGLAATATIPVGTGLTPGYISWGDATPAAAVAGGAATATHVYALAGTYTVTYRPSAQSDKVYTGSVTMA